MSPPAPFLHINFTLQLLDHVSNAGAFTSETEAMAHRGVINRPCLCAFLFSWFFSSHLWFRSLSSFLWTITMDKYYFRESYNDVNDAHRFRRCHPESWCLWRFIFRVTLRTFYCLSRIAVTRTWHFIRASTAEFNTKQPENIGFKNMIRIEGKASPQCHKCRLPDI